MSKKMTSPAAGGSSRTFNERARTAGSRIIGILAGAAFLLFGETAWEGASPVIEETLMLLACIFAGIGALGRVWCSLYLEGKKNNTLVREGPYALCRNPLYFFSFIGAAGTSLATETITIPIIVCALFALYYPTIISAEQRRLEVIFGEDYLAYKRDVPAVLPRLFSRVPAQPESYVVNARRFTARVIDAAWFIWFIGVMEFSAGLHEAGVLPTYFRLY